MENLPNKIYLQIGDADVTIDQDTNDFNDLFRGAITWADERINDNDIEYERRLDVDLKNAALPIFDVSNNEVVVCDCNKGKFVFNEVKQELICGCGRRIRITN